MPDTELVIFDHDGVLVDSEVIAMRIIAQMLTHHGLATTLDEAFERYLGTGLDFVTNDLQENGYVVDVPTFSDKFHEQLFNGFRTELQAIPGIPELLKRLHVTKVPIAIASSGERQRVELGITSAGLAEHFPSHSITTREDADRGKPHPDLFLAAARKAQMTPDRCLVIEDSAHGVEAARRAAMPVIGLAYRTPRGKLTDADWVVGDGFELHEVLLREGFIDVV